MKSIPLPAVDVPAILYDYLCCKSSKEYDKKQFGFSFTLLVFQAFSPQKRIFALLSCSYRTSEGKPIFERAFNRGKNFVSTDLSNSH